MALNRRCPPGAIGGDPGLRDLHIHVVLVQVFSVLDVSVHVAFYVLDLVAFHVLDLGDCAVGFVVAPGAHEEGDVPVVVRVGDGGLDRSVEGVCEAGPSRDGTGVERPELAEDAVSHADGDAASAVRPPGVRVRPTALSGRTDRDGSSGTVETVTGASLEDCARNGSASVRPPQSGLPTDCRGQGPSRSCGSISRCPWL